MSEEASSSIPSQVEEVLKSTQIGYLSVMSKKGDLYSYPVAYHYADKRVYMMTPITSAKMKFMKANPNISFLVDNKKLALDACGAMIQGKAKVLSMGKMIASIISLGPKMISFAKKYPGMFTFYARGKYLPDERKLYKYRFIRIDPTKFVYWTGYTFGRYMPRETEKKKVPDLEDPSKMESLVGLLATVDNEEVEEATPDKSPVDQDWLSELNSAVSSGILSEDEMRVIGMYKRPLGVADNVKPGELSQGEKSILKKWRSSRT
ncbi:MAG TPA: pyridoxamine 5'-phosphate oxidase family protein [Nitrososphaerales archaeon]|nr:pyridoxamine 5'-phosphate oxidase family protein [Nitrososphaerales archaeon]